MSTHTIETLQSKINKNQVLDLVLRLLTVALLLYLFLIGVKVLGDSFKLMGGGFAKGLLNITANPIAGLFAWLYIGLWFGLVFDESESWLFGFWP